MFETIWQDLRHGARMLAHSPGFTLVAMLSIAIGVGINAAMFSLADGLVLRPLPVPHPNDVVAVSAIAPRADAAVFNSNRGVSYRDYVDLRDRTRSFAGLAAYQVILEGFADRRDQPAQSRLGLAVSGNFFDVLGLRPAQGRFFLPGEDQVPGRDAVVVLANQTWVDQFGADPAIINRRIRIGGLDFAVIGVAPESFTGMHLVLSPAFYVPLAMMTALPGALPNQLERRDFRTLDVRGRLKPGVSLEQARQETRLFAEDLERAFPDTNRNFGLLVSSAFDARLAERGPSAPSAFALLTLAFAVLLVACANVAGLLMSRAPVRQREVALRLAIGGGRLRVARQLVTETVLLAAGGGALGLALAYGGVLFLRRLPIVSDIGVRLIFDLDRRAVTVGLVLAAASALVSSLIPAWRATRKVDLTSALVGGAGSRNGPGHTWTQNCLVVGQVALSLILLTLTVFQSRQFTEELKQPGFRTEHILLSGFEPSLAGYTDGQSDAFFTTLEERARALPGVTSVGLTSIMPLNQDYREFTPIVPEGFQMPPDTESITVLTSRIDEGYLDTIGIGLVQGRDIRESDTADSPRVALVNEAMAARYWPGQSPIGRRIHFVAADGQPWVEVVGVTRDSKYNWIGEGATPWMYIPRRQDRGVRSTLLVATTGDAAALAAPLRDLVQDIDPNMPISGVRTMADFYAGNATGIVTALVRVTGSMGLMALALATVGLYGLVAYFVARRTREIGVRMAVGAKPASVLRMVLGHGLVLAGLGAAIGLVGSVGALGLARSVFGDGSLDVATLLLPIPVLLAVTVLAAYVPARRAAHIDPLVALRVEQ